MFDFDDSRLENPDVLAAAAPLLMNLASSGARVRREAAMAEGPLAVLDDLDRPRALIAYGPEARLLRAVLEPVCPVPFVAWPALGLPGWVGPLDIVLLIGRRGPESLAVAHEAVRRGCRLIVACPPDSPLAVQAASRATTVLPVNTGDPLAAAVVCLVALHRLGLGPYPNPDAVAAAMDTVAESCSARTDVSVNPAKAMALDLADASPLVWGGSVLAARASRRIVEALRLASGRVGLAADASDLRTLLHQAPPRDPFADPFEEGPQERRPGLVLIDDGLDDAAAAEARRRLERTAQAADIRITRLEHLADSVMERYATVLLTGLFGAAYLQIGLGRIPS
ncbi:MAG: SIS domain-containing protein [Micropruina sp.]